MVGLDGENLPKQRLGLCQSAGAVVRQGNLKDLVYGYVRHH